MAQPLTCYTKCIEVWLSFPSAASGEQVPPGVRQLVLILDIQLTRKTGGPINSALAGTRRTFGRG
jgi:hypothetical protein